MSDVRPKIAVIGGGDIDAIANVVRDLPRDSGLSFLVVAGGLDGHPGLQSELPVESLDGRVVPQADRIYIAPHDRDVVFAKGALITVDPIANVRAPLDRLMRSLADELGRDAAAVILSGDGSDGAFGIKRIKEAGGVTICQDPVQATRTEMPAAAVATGLVDVVLPLAAIAPELVRLTDRNHDAAKVDDDGATLTESDVLREILTLVRVRTGHDFSQYKRGTLFRRIARRMQVCGCDSLANYQYYLREHAAEVGNLVRDFVISVTSFFRDPEAYAFLDREVLLKLFAAKTDQIRVWVPACATGEEAYSLAMLLVEHASLLDQSPRIQLFATDIDDAALVEARNGVYPQAIAIDVPQSRLERFFEREAGGYRVRKDLRDLVLFSPHNMLRDPPFSKLDLISCRNLLIYLNRDAQDRVLAMFHFALRPGGTLCLGSSESAETPAMLFSALDSRMRVFERRITPTPHAIETMISGRWWPAPAQLPARSVGSFGELHHRIVEQYAPPSVLVNDELEIVHLSEHAGRFFELAGGEPSRNLLQLVHPALRLDLRTAIYAARQSGLLSATRIVKFEDKGEMRVIELRARLVDQNSNGAGVMLILFDELDATDRGPAPILIPTARAMEPIVRDLEDELHRTREQLRTTVEQYETSLEELKASNEELHAINEELRATSEELETSKEELQSVNEELTALNQQLKIKIEQLGRSNSDLQNLMTSTDVGVVFLDRKLDIKLFTPRARDLFNVIPSDVGRPLAHVTHRLEYDHLPEVARDVLDKLQPIELSARSRDGKRYLIRVTPYRSIDDRIEGVVLTFIDVTDLRFAEAALHASEARFDLAMHNAPIIVTTQDLDLRYVWKYVLGREELGEEHPAVLSASAASQLDAFRRDVIAVRRGQRTEIELDVGTEIRHFDVRIEPVMLDGEITGVTTVAFDITTSKQSERQLREADRRKDEFLATLSHELRNPLTPLRVALDVQRTAGTDTTQLATTQAIMDRQITQLTHLVDELLDVARITQGKIRLDLTLIDTRTIVDAAVEATRPLFDAANHRLDVIKPSAVVMVRGDYFRLTQVVTNLLSNAARFTPPGGDIRIELRPDYQRKVVAFRVRDNGVGIPIEALPHVFELFVQCRDETGRARGGLGIGLSLVRRLIELHGGTATARSDGEGRGSELVAELPLDPMTE